MATKLSAKVMQNRDGQESEVRLYVRSVGKGRKFLGTPEERSKPEVDAWAAYSEESIFLDLASGRRQACVIAERVSFAPRDTIEEAAADMHREVHLLLEEKGSRLVSGELPEKTHLVGSDPMGDA
jgi:hypothetical protein